MNNANSLRWLHAGLYKDAKSATKDVWYAFKKDSRGRRRIVYASDWFGTSFGNKNAGRWKSDLITWDKHHSDKWSQYITAKGTWEYKHVMLGRAVQRNSLLRTWLDPNSPNIHAHGKDKNRTLGPPLNVIHTTNDKSPGGVTPVAARVPLRSHDAPRAESYPGTRIPFSTIRIVVGAFNECDKDPLKVIANFLTSQLACHPKFKSHRTEQNDQVESAFYECGWRIYRQAVERANDDMALGKIENAFQSKLWRQNPPLWIDKFKGDRLDLLLRQMKAELMADKDGNKRAEDDEDESPDATPPMQSTLTQTLTPTTTISVFLRARLLQDQAGQARSQNLQSSLRRESEKNRLPASNQTSAKGSILVL